MLFQIKMGMVDRGANVSWASQFPAENEVLFAPLTGLEVIAPPWVEGNTIMISLRISTNLRDMTIDEVIGKMKRSHLDLINYITEDLKCTGVDDPTILLPITSLLRRQEIRLASDFNTAASFIDFTEELFETRKLVMASVCEPGTWEVVMRASGKPAAVARMRKVIALVARAGEFSPAMALTLTALQYEPLNREWQEQVSAALNESNCASQITEVERAVLDAAAQMIFMPSLLEPKLLVAMLGTLSIGAVRAFGLLVRGQGLHTIAVGAEVMVWRNGRQQWEAAVVANASSRNSVFDVHIGGKLVRGLSQTAIRRMSTGAVGSLLFHAAAEGSLPLVDALLMAGVRPNMEGDEHGDTPLHYAVRGKHPQIVKRLLDAKAEPETNNFGGITPWELALQVGAPLVRRAFSPSASDLDRPFESELSPLQLASMAADVQAVEELLRQPAVADTVDVATAAGMTALMLAAGSLRSGLTDGRAGEARHDSVGTVRALLRAKADVQKRSTRGSMPLGLAAEVGSTEVTQVLLEAGAQVDARDQLEYSPLQLGCENGHAEVVRLLLANQADSEQARHNGWTPLMTAAYNGCTGVVLALTTHGADAKRAKQSGFSPLIAAVYNGFDETARLLLDHGAPLNERMRKGDWTPLMVSASQGHVKTTALLLQRGARIDEAKPNGLTPLILAAAAGHEATVARLLQSRALVDVQDQHRSSALMHAVRHGHHRTCETLITAGASIDLAREHGVTPLHEAAAYGHEKVVALLIARKAALDAQATVGESSSEMSAMQIASQAGHAPVVLRLIHAGASIGSSGASSPLSLASTPAVAIHLLRAGADASEVPQQLIPLDETLQRLASKAAPAAANGALGSVKEALIATKEALVAGPNATVAVDVSLESVDRTHGPALNDEEAIGDTKDKEAIGDTKSHRALDGGANANVAVDGTKARPKAAHSAPTKQPAKTATGAASDRAPQGSTERGRRTASKLGSGARKSTPLPSTVASASNTRASSPRPSARTSSPAARASSPRSNSAHANGGKGKTTKAKATVDGQSARSGSDAKMHKLSGDPNASATIKAKPQEALDPLAKVGVLEAFDDDSTGVESVDFLKVRIRQDQHKQRINRKASWKMALLPHELSNDDAKLRDAAAQAIQSIFHSKAAKREHGFQLPSAYPRLPI